MKIEHSKEPVDEFGQPPPDSLRAEDEIKAVHSNGNMRRGILAKLPTDPHRKTCVPAKYHTVTAKSLCFADFYVQNFQQSYAVCVATLLGTTPLVSAGSRPVVYVPSSSDSTSETISGLHGSYPGVLHCRSSSPAALLRLSRSPQFPPSWCYLMRPSLLTGPSSDLGSGDRELQDVLEQGPTAGQEEVCVAHRSPVTQKAPVLLSTHASRG